ncbi:MAG: hypothetical protein GWP19_05460 [Planctomycetia bacterium]|nr:hypothetical protein [Planctomycetia bacterium]
MFLHSKIFAIPLFSLVTVIFSLQIFLQSVPIAERIVVNGDVLCTCGCGHTISVCAANHGEGSNCKCQHDKKEETIIKFAANTINTFVITPLIYSNVIHFTGILCKTEYSSPDEFLIDILVPPPRFYSA